MEYQELALQGYEDTEVVALKYKKEIEDLKGEQKMHQDYLRWLRERVDQEEQAFEETEKKLHSAQAHLTQLENPASEPVELKAPPPGPRSLRWVDGDAFTMVGMAVIVFNILVMVDEMVNPKHAGAFFWLDQAFLVFYIAELILKALLYQKGLLCGKVSVVAWNWLDLVIVLSGILDQWLMPMMQSDQDGPSIMDYIRILRLARLVRVVKLVHIFLTHDLHWTEGPKFQGFIMGVICFNAILIGLEADMPDYWMWFYFENALVLIFSFELFVRLKYQRANFFCHREDVFWNWLDFIIVTVAILDQWLLPAFTMLQKLWGAEDNGGHNSASDILMIIRMARLLRILRLVRLIRGVPQLKTLVVGIAKSMCGMGWVLVLTITVLYVCALLFVKLVGPHGLVGGFESEVTELFNGVLETMFNLFIVMNADLSGMEPFLNYGITPKLVMFLFTVMSNWAIFSILTAVICDHMASVSAETAEEREKLEAAQKEEESLMILNKLFDEVDASHSGTISRSEFEQMLQDENKSRVFEDATCMSGDELVDLFSILSRLKPSEDEPLIYRDDFIDGLKKDKNSVSMRSVMRLEKHLTDLEASFHAFRREMTIR